MSARFDSPLPHLPLTVRQALALPPPARARVIAYLLQWGEYASARALLEPVVHLTPESVLTRAQLCECLVAMGELAGARQVARDLNALARDNPATLAAIGDVLAAEGQLDRAESYYRRCTHQNRLTAPALRRIAECRLRAGRADEALALATSLRVLHEAEQPDTPVPVALLRLQAAAAAGSGRREEAAALCADLEARRRRADAQMRDFLAAWPQSDRVREARPEYGTAGGPAEALRRIFGYEAFRPGQQEIVEALLAGEHVLAVLPTGAGKSLCYQLPAMLLPGTTLVVSPLIALMKDQVERLPPAAYGLSTCLHSGLEPGEAAERLRGIAEGRYRLVYAAPERLRQLPFTRALRRAGVSLMVVDEAHCVSLWGHDFRPDYLFLGEAWEHLGRPTVLAMTATATPAMQDEIAAQFGLPFRRVVREAYRPNLKLEVIAAADEPEKRRRLLEVCRETRGAGIIYVRSRERAEELAVYLDAMGLPADRYHAGLDAEERAAVQAAFMLGQARFLVATVAFGMGIDKTNVRLVLHHDLPESPEAYTQEAGRAGRDGKPSRCVLLHAPADRAILRARLRLGRPAADRVAAVAAAIRERLRGGEAQIARDDLERDLGAESTEVRVAISLLEQCGALRRGFDLPRAITLFMRRAPESPEERAQAERARLRPRQRLTLGPAEWCERLGVAAGALESLLLDAAEAGWLEYRGSGRAMRLERTEDTGDAPARLRDLLRRAQEEETRRLQTLLDYLDVPGCRAQFLASYFATPVLHPCGQCDRCVDCGLRSPGIADCGLRIADCPTKTASTVYPNPQSAIRNPQSSDELAEEIYQRLRAWRRLEAEAAGKAPFEVAGDEALRAVAEQQPHAVMEMAGLPGLAPEDLERYGEAILDIVMGAIADGRAQEEPSGYTKTGPTSGEARPYQYR